eukprot:GHVR01169473.1.p1 GENE.GHVR01169473.1~~GHVR01169473.1.p1  ORF type:complete len:258 (+),score=33.90 GHVR01169473.1:126-899(+)
MVNRLEGKIALITGGANGIGKGIAELFYMQGATVIIVDIAAQEPQVPNKFYNDYLSFDVSYEENWVAIINFIRKKYNKLNILVNNAGINALNSNQDPENMLFETWKYVSLINSGSVVLGCKHTINLMKENNEGSSIVNIASRSGIVGVPNLAAYASSKAAIRNYTQSVAIYCASKNYNIRCNTVSPASVDTQMCNHLKDNKGKFDSYVNSLPLKRLGGVIDVAYAVLYLASDESAYTTGAEIIVDGGTLATNNTLPK